MNRPSGGDVVAGATVALVLIPQSLAYAELAGVPAERGLHVAAVATLAASPFVSSPYLQTGPSAITALLSFAAVSSVTDASGATFVGLSALLALVVGAVRLGVGLLRLGAIAYLMSQAVLAGFLPAAAILIVSTQLPGGLGVPGGEGNALKQAALALAHPSQWRPEAVGIFAVTLLVMLGGRRLSPLLPTVLAVVAAAIVYSAVTGYEGAVVGEVTGGLPSLSVDLPWRSLSQLLLPGVVIALVGFAEPSAVARSYAAMDRQVWDASQEFVGQGAANLAAGLVGGFPAGGSLSRTALNRRAGARSRWSGMVTGLVVLAFLPFVGILSDLPMACLSAVVVGAVARLIRLKPLVGLAQISPLQFMVAAATFGFALALSPALLPALVVGVILAVAVHLAREASLTVSTWLEGSVLHLRPEGVLYFGSAPTLESSFLENLRDNPHVERLVLHLDSLGRIDLTGATVLQAVIADARGAGLEADLIDVPAHAARIIARVFARGDDSA